MREETLRTLVTLREIEFEFANAECLADLREVLYASTMVARVEKSPVLTRTQ